MQKLKCLKLNSFDLGSSRQLVVYQVTGAFKAHLLACSGQEVVLSTGVSKVNKYSTLRPTLMTSWKCAQNNGKANIIIKTVWCGWERVSGRRVEPHLYQYAAGSHGHMLSVETPMCIQQSVMSGTEQTFKDLPLTLCWKIDEAISNIGYQSVSSTGCPGTSWWSRPSGTKGKIWPEVTCQNCLLLSVIQLFIVCSWMSS